MERNSLGDTAFRGKLWRRGGVSWCGKEEGWRAGS